MPTKPNRSGEQQNYVPAGNGDASGEYGDNETGSNIHFTSFKKPEGEDTQTGGEQPIKKFTQFQGSKGTEKPEHPIKKEDSKDKRQSATNKLIGKCVNRTQDNDDTFKKTIEDTNDEGVAIIDEYLSQNDKLQIKFGSAGRNAAGRAWGYSNIDTNHDAHTIRHELGHTFDNWYGKDLPDNGRNNFESQDYASVRYVDPETGKTMNETLHEELGVSMSKMTLNGWKFSYKKQGVDKREVKEAAAKRINNVFNKYGDKIYDEITGVPNARETLKQLRIKHNDIKYNIDKDLADTEEYKELERLRKEQYRIENEYTQKMFRAGAYSVSYNDSPEILAARTKTDEARRKYEELKAKRFNEKFGEKDLEIFDKLVKNEYSVYGKMKGVAGLVGDTFDYLGAGSSFYTTNGHGSHYFKQRREAGYVLEIFANMFDCYTSKDTWKKECVKEMFPKTSKIFEKIYYKKGKE